MLAVCSMAVSVVLEIEEGVAEYYKAQRIGTSNYYVCEIEKVIFVGTLIPSNDWPGSFIFLNELFALIANRETRAIVENPNLNLVELLPLMDRYGWAE